MTREAILKLVREQVAAALQCDLEEVREDSSLVRDLGAESIDLIDLTFRLEKTFSIRIPEGDLFDPKPGKPAPVDTVAEVVAYLSTRAGG
jgi:acyl carrier protein